MTVFETGVGGFRPLPAKKNVYVKSKCYIAPFTLDMAESVSALSLDGDNRRFLPDEVFETTEDAAGKLAELIAAYESGGPFVYAVCLKTGEHIGHVQLVKLYDDWEVGYHIGEPYGGNGYAAEAVRAFLPVMAEKVGAEIVLGVCRADNAKSRRVLERSGFVLKREFEAEWYGTRRLSVEYTWANRG